MGMRFTQDFVRRDLDHSGVIESAMANRSTGLPKAAWRSKSLSGAAA